MRLVLLIVIFGGQLLYAQKLDAWLSKEIEEDPSSYISGAAKLVPATSIEAAGNFFALGKSYEYLNQEDLALKYYMLSKKEFDKLKLEEPSKDLALEIHRVISSQENYDKYGDTFLKEYYAYAEKTKSPLRLAYTWNEFAKDAYSLYDPALSNTKVLDSAYTLFKKGLDFALKSGNQLAIAKLYGNIGAVESSRKNFNAARSNLSNAHKIIVGEKDDYELFLNHYNRGNSYFIEGNYNEAIKWFRKTEKINLPAYRDKFRRLLYRKLMESYDAIDDQPNRRKYQKLYQELDNKIQDTEQNIAIHDINVKYQVAEKNKQISSLSQFRDKFYKNRLVFAILLFLVFLLALYSFVRWKKIDYRKKRLEAEKKKVQEEKLEIEQKHTKTVAELEKVKSIVTEGHIILKDKTKIYLNDLMYVKSEDHYLHAVSSDGKKHFVRGKLSQILSELPPNFAKCHRSYIVNTNYIQSVQQGFITLKNKEEIPVSRSFKL